MIHRAVGQINRAHPGESEIGGQGGIKLTLHEILGLVKQGRICRNIVKLSPLHIEIVLVIVGRINGRIYDPYTRLNLGYTPVPASSVGEGIPVQLLNLVPWIEISITDPLAGLAPVVKHHIVRIQCSVGLVITLAYPEQMQAVVEVVQSANLSIGTIGIIRLILGDIGPRSETTLGKPVISAFQGFKIEDIVAVLHGSHT